MHETIEYLDDEFIYIMNSSRKFSKKSKSNMLFSKMKKKFVILENKIIIAKGISINLTLLKVMQEDANVKINNYIAFKELEEFKRVLIIDQKVFIETEKE